jgi:hypothetical protein
LARNVLQILSQSSHHRRTLRRAADQVFESRTRAVGPGHIHVRAQRRNVRTAAIMITTVMISCNARSRFTVGRFPRGGNREKRRCDKRGPDPSQPVGLGSRTFCPVDNYRRESWSVPDIINRARNPRIHHRPRTPPCTCTRARGSTVTVSPPLPPTIYPSSDGHHSPLHDVVTAPRSACHIPRSAGPRHSPARSPPGILTVVSPSSLSPLPVQCGARR